MQFDYIARGKELVLLPDLAYKSNKFHGTAKCIYDIFLCNRCR